MINPVDIRKLQEQERLRSDISSAVNSALKAPAKNYKDCKYFKFKPRNKQDIRSILEYFRDRAFDIFKKIPEHLLKEAK